MPIEPRGPWFKSLIPTCTLKKYKKTFKRERTWQTPETAAMVSKLKAFARKSNCSEMSVFSFGGGPGTVGIASTPKS